MPTLAVIAGPTGAGKSALALRLARERGGWIINADASQLYRDLAVLTARPTAADEVLAPHRLYGVLDATEVASAGAWAARAAAVVAAAHAAGALPILVGGSGLYLRTLLDGVAPVPPIDPAIRAAVRALPPAEAHAALAREDPGAAVADPQRVARALEVVRSTSRPLAWWFAATPPGLAATHELDARVVDVDRAVLAARLERRLDAMLAGGALDEVAALAARALPPGLPVMKAVGVREFAAHLRAETTLAQARAASLTATLQLAKRQRTWFRHQTPAWTRVPG